MLAEFPNGSTGSIHVSTTSPVNLGEEIVAIGTDGIVAIQADEQQIGELPAGEVRQHCSQTSIRWFARFSC